MGRPRDRLAALLAGRHGVADELDRLLERDGRVPTGVANLDAQRDVGQNVSVGVDRVDRPEGGLDSLDAVLLADRATSSRLGLLGRGSLVDGHEDAQHELARNGGNRVPIGHLQKRVALTNHSSGQDHKAQAEQNQTNRAYRTHLTGAFEEL